jgi:hypothetical protein
MYRHSTSKPTVNMWKLSSWSTVGVEGIFGGMVNCVKIGKNTNGESTLLGQH